LKFEIQLFAKIALKDFLNAFLKLIILRQKSSIHNSIILFN
jgi:hypothetical protein